MMAPRPGFSFPRLALPFHDRKQQADLIEAAKKGQCKRIKRLLKAGAVVALEGANGSTALHWACYKGHVDAVVTMVRWVQRWKRKHPDPNNARRDSA